MAKKSIDELIEAIEAVQILQEAVTKHDKAIEGILDKLDRMQDRLAALEAKTHRNRP